MNDLVEKHLILCNKLNTICNWVEAIPYSKELIIYEGE